MDLLVLLSITTLALGNAFSHTHGTDGLHTTPVAITDVRYEVTYDRETASRRVLLVAMHFRAAGQGVVELSLPAWTPGAYRVANFARNVQRFAATTEGRPLRWDKADHDTWRVRTAGAQPVTVRFEYHADQLTCEEAWTAEEFAFFNGTNVFLYPEAESLVFPSRVAIHTEPDWKVATGMTPAAGVREYVADSYHQLVDMPVFVGSMDLDSVRIGGRWFRLATYPAGRMAGGARETWWDEVRRMMPPMEAVFGETPFETYTTLMAFDSAFPGGAALEHENSHLGVYSPSFIGTPVLASITAHEVLHVWNVKRLRPAEMVPYAYGRIQPTTLLWMSEGVTDYYADLALLRAGISSEQDFYRATLEKMDQVRSAPPVALEDASLSTWIEPTDGTATIYYQKGSLAGLLLDILIRDASGNRGSLDDVMRALYQSTDKRKRGFTEEEWWRAVTDAAGGRSFTEFAARYIDGRDEYPWADLLPRAGMLLTADTTSVLSLGAGLGFNTTSQRVIVQSVLDGRPMSDAGVQTGDTLLQLGEVALMRPESFSEFLRRYGGAQDGTTIGIRLQRGGDTLSLEMPVRHVDRVTRSLDRDPNATPKAIRIRDGILSGSATARRTGTSGGQDAARRLETGTVTDVDGNMYRTVKIGNQWWMAENLRVTRDPAGQPIAARAYADDESLVAAHGRLYSWDVAMSGATQPGARGIAPEGWRIPTDDDWDRLFTFLGGESVAGGKLKEVGMERWQAPNTGATDTFGFAGRPSGGSNGQVFEGLGIGAHFWSSTGTGQQAGAPTLNNREAAVTRLQLPKLFLLSVRCVRDAE